MGASLADAVRLGVAVAVAHGAPGALHQRLEKRAVFPQCDTQVFDVYLVTAGSLAFQVVPCLGKAFRQPLFRAKCRSVVLIPIGLGAVKLEDSVSPVEVSHVRPVILVEAGGALEHLLIEVQDELFFNCVDLESAPRNGK